MPFEVTRTRACVRVFAARESDARESDARKAIVGPFVDTMLIEGVA